MKSGFSKRVSVIERTSFGIPTILYSTDEDFTHEIIAAEAIKNETIEMQNTSYKQRLNSPKDISMLKLISTKKDKCSN